MKCKEGMLSVFIGAAILALTTANGPYTYGTAWGFEDNGGWLTNTDNNRVVNLDGTSDSSHVVAMQCGYSACVARFLDGSATVWGDQGMGGDITDTEDNRDVDLSSGVVDISCGNEACVARFEDGSATAWGHRNSGGDLTRLDYSDSSSTRVVDLSSGVVDIGCGKDTCWALFNDSSATVWGNEGGGDLALYSDVDLSSGVVEIGCVGPCWAIYDDGSAAVWGSASANPDGSDSVDGQPIDLTSNVTKISCGHQVCMVIYDNGSAKVWGNEDRGGDITMTDNDRVVNLDSDVVDGMCGYSYACVARFADGSATVWGGRDVLNGQLTYGGDITKTGVGMVVDLSSGVEDIMCGKDACVARFADGSAAVWGDQLGGGNHLNNKDQTFNNWWSGENPVIDIGCGDSCWARFEDGSATVWGTSTVVRMIPGVATEDENREVPSFDHHVQHISCGLGLSCVAILIGCDSGYVYDPVANTCTAASCGQPSQNAEFLPAVTTTGAEVEVTCNDGYLTEDGDKTFQASCVADSYRGPTSTWFTDEQVCEEQRCLSPYIPNAHNVGSGDIGDRRRVSCFTDYWAEDGHTGFWINCEATATGAEWVGLEDCLRENANAAIGAAQAGLSIMSALSILSVFLYDAF